MCFNQCVTIRWTFFHMTTYRIRFRCHCNFKLRVNEVDLTRPTGSNPVVNENPSRRCWIEESRIYVCVFAHSLEISLVKLKICLGLFSKKGFLIHFWSSVWVYYSEFCRMRLEIKRLEICKAILILTQVSGFVELTDNRVINYGHF